VSFKHIEVNKYAVIRIIPMVKSKYDQKSSPMLTVDGKNYGGCGRFKNTSSRPMTCFFFSGPHMTKFSPAHEYVNPKTRVTLISGPPSLLFPESQNNHAARTGTHKPLYLPALLSIELSHPMAVLARR
jgi:hypothetical protein